MEIIYVIINLILITSMMLVKRKKEKIDFMNSLVIVIVLKLCYNIVVCYANNLAKIPITLFTLSIENLIISLMIIIKIIREKSIQKYNLYKKDLIYFCILIVFLLFFIIKQYGIPMGIKYLCTDYLNHFKNALDFSERTSLLNTSTRPGAYINIGICFKVMEPYIGRIELYKIFSLCDVFCLGMQSAVIYIISKKYIKKIGHYILAVAISILAICTYPLNSMLLGFTYLSLAMLFVISSVAVFRQYQNGEVSKWTMYTEIALLNFGVAFSYYFFIPAIYLAIFSYKLLETIVKKKKVISWDNIMFSIFVFVIPAICCFQYHFLNRIKSTGMKQISTQATTEGYIYNAVYVIFILLAPPIIYYIYKQIKNFYKKTIEEKNKRGYTSKIDYSCFLIISLFLYGCFCFVLNQKGILSNYGFFKIHYVFSNIVFYMFFKGIILLINEGKIKKILAMSYITIYIVIAFYKFIFQMSAFEYGINGKENIKNAFNLYEMNRAIINYTPTICTNKEYELLRFANENIGVKNEKILLVLYKRVDTIFKHTFKGENTKAYYEVLEPIQGYGYKIDDYQKVVDNTDFKYIIYMDRSFNSYKVTREQVSKGKKVLYENETGAVYENLNYKERKYK